jgi:Na+/H+-dicarboxylate symporter
VGFVFRVSGGVLTRPAGCFLHSLSLTTCLLAGVVLPGVYMAVTGDRKGPRRVTVGAAAALATAFATDSSAAALPVTLRVSHSLTQINGAKETEGS